MGYLDSMSKDYIAEIQHIYDEFVKFKSQAKVYGLNFNFYNDWLTTEVFQKLDYDLVIYDEIEKFRDYDDSKFNYPYDNRKIKLESFVFNATSLRFSDDFSYTLLNYNYA